MIIQPTQGLICFFCFWKHLLASLSHHLLWLPPTNSSQSDNPQRFYDSWVLSRFFHLRNNFCSYLELRKYCIDFFWFSYYCFKKFSEKGIIRAKKSVFLLWSSFLHIFNKITKMRRYLWNVEDVVKMLVWSVSVNIAEMWDAGYQVQNIVHGHVVVVRTLAIVANNVGKGNI